MLQPNSFRFVATKVAVDGILFGPLDLLVFFTYMGFSTGKSVPQIKEDVKRDFLPALILEGGIWPIAQVANFRFIPVRYQLLYVNFFCLLDSCFLSWVEQQQDAPWKQWLKSLLPLKEQKGQVDKYSPNLVSSFFYGLSNYCGSTCKKQVKCGKQP
ncbi:Mpv17/PMP22 [Quillaja saponaria]|uniref:Mpv17/PMP22 n=1 Tax=Quillaja saponaria TaxID=32244 RepID=A0AAD7LIK0_QUISA|nr:Mpv17/PMP22 [Quillaja saponaria]